MPRFSDLTADQISEVVEALRARQYYLLCGSGISLDSEGACGRMASASALRDTLCDLKSISRAKSLQQAYGLLDEEEKNKHLTIPYKCINPGETVSAITRYPFRRIFTFNIDDCLESSMSRILCEYDDIYSNVDIKNYNDDFSDLSSFEIQSIIHLHGSVLRPKEGYVFSQTEYTKNVVRPNSWMLNLVQLIRSEPFIVAGTTLDEPDVAYYLEQRNNISARGDVAPSILVEPYPDALTEALCEKHEFYLFHGTTLQFFEQIQGESAPAIYWNPPPSSYLEKLSVPAREKAEFDAAFEIVPKSLVADTSAAPFLLGGRLTWEKLEGNVDVPRDVFSSLRKVVDRHVQADEARLLVLLDEPGSGKSSLIRRLAFAAAKIHKNVFLFVGQSSVTETAIANVIDNIVGPVFIYVDNIADHGAFISGVLGHTKRSDIVFVCAERLYRRSYIETIFPDEDIGFVERHLNLSKTEGRRLISSYQSSGLSALGLLSNDQISKHAGEIAGDAIAVAACRIQNDFRAFDRIVQSLIGESSSDEIETYATVGVARFCYAGGVHRAVLYEARPSPAIERMLNPYSPMPLAYADRARQYVVPGRSVTAERVVTLLHEGEPDRLEEIFADLANALASRVNRGEIRRRSPAAKLAGGLIDYDRVIRLFINPLAEKFYEDISSGWSWNSRYWEQRALLNLDRFLSQPTDVGRLEEGIQNARFAYSIEHHPFSLTTLAKLLFAAMDEPSTSKDELFAEAWKLINNSIEIEIGWAGVKSTAFVVCFNGVLAYTRAGGRLNGQQISRLQDVVAITRRKSFRHKVLLNLRDQILTEVL